MRTRRQPSRLERAHREAVNLVNFIDAHGGKLGAFRAYRLSPPTTPPPEPGSSSPAPSSSRP
jgi:hypothetical protein